MNSENERQALLRFFELMSRIGPRAFMALVYLNTTADRVNGQLVASTSCREAADVLGLSRSTASRIFNDLRVQHIIEGSVSSRGSRFVVPESVLALSSDSPAADRIP